VNTVWKVLIGHSFKFKSKSKVILSSELNRFV